MSIDIRLPRIDALADYPREAGLFGVWCLRRAQHLLPDEVTVSALHVAANYHNNRATQQMLSAAERVCSAVLRESWQAPYCFAVEAVACLTKSDIPGVARAARHAVAVEATSVGRDYADVELVEYTAQELELSRVLECISTGQPAYPHTTWMKAEALRPFYYISRNYFWKALEALQDRPRALRLFSVWCVRNYAGSAQLPEVVQQALQVAETSTNSGELQEAQRLVQIASVAENEAAVADPSRALSALFLIVAYHALSPTELNAARDTAYAVNGFHGSTDPALVVELSRVIRCIHTGASPY